MLGKAMFLQVQLLKILQNIGPARDASERPLLSQQGIIASDSNNLFYPVNSTLPSQPYSLPNVPIQQQNPAYVQPFSHIPMNWGHLSQPPPSFHSSPTSYPVSFYNNPNFNPPLLSSSYLETPVQCQHHHHQLPQIPQLPNNFPHHNQNQQNQSHQSFVSYPPNNQLPVQYVYYMPSPLSTPSSPSPQPRSLPSVSHLPILTSKLDFFAWDEGVTSLLHAHGLLGHILNPTKLLDPMWPDRVSKPLPVLLATPMSQDLADLTAWWDDNNAAQHVLTSKIGTVPQGLLPSLNLSARTALSIYQTLVWYYGICSFADCAELLNSINNSYCQLGCVQEYVSKWRTAISWLQSARFPFSIKLSISQFVQGLPSIPAFNNLRANLPTHISVANDQDYRAFVTLTETALELDTIFWSANC